MVRQDKLPKNLNVCAREDLKEFICLEIHVYMLHVMGHFYKRKINYLIELIRH